MAEACAETLCRSHANEGVSYLARARSRARFHRFDEALADLDESERLGADREPVFQERATIYQAKGEFDAALEILQRNAGPQSQFASCGALAVFHAEQGDCSTAEEYFNRSLGLISRQFRRFPWPFWSFRAATCGWHSTTINARGFGFKSLSIACRSSPLRKADLAEVEAECGEPESAVARLIPLTTSSDDPDYAAALARILHAADQAEEASAWRSMAAERYEELVSRHYDAFADHAAAFLLEQGGDPHRALSLAKRNLEIRRTARSVRLFECATRACEIVTQDRRPHV